MNKLLDEIGEITFYKLAGVIAEVRVSAKRDIEDIRDELRQRITEISPHSSTQTVGYNNVAIVNPEGMQPAVMELLEKNPLVSDLEEVIVKLRVR